MTMQDPISDMLTRIRNGQHRTKREVAMPSSTQKVALAEVLKNEGFITDFRVEGEKCTERTLESQQFATAE